MKQLYYLITIFAFWVNLANSFCLTNYTNTDNFQFQKYEDAQEDVNVWITVDKTPAYNCFKDDTSILNKLEIRKRYRVVNDNYRIRYGGKEWSLLVDGLDASLDTKKIVGWVSHDALLFNNKPIENSDTRIYVKVLIKQGDKKGGKVLTVYEDREKTDTKEGIEVRTVFYVYDYFPRTTGSPEDDNTESLLISPLSRLDLFENKASLLVGWVDRKNVTFWNTRTAFETPVGASLEIKDENGRVAFRSDRVTKPLPYNSLRNPILKDEGESYRVGTFARLSRDQFITRTMLTEIATGLEILFVIDGTRSMSKAFKDTMRGVKSIAQTLVAQSKEIGLEQPRFGLSFYRDKATVRPVRLGDNGNLINVDNIEYCTSPVTVNPFGDYDNFCILLQDQIACDGDMTRPESLYQGLVQAVRESNFLKGQDSEPLRMRIVVHIGDAGDNGNSEYQPKDVAYVFNKNHIFKYIAIDISSTSDTGFFDSVKPLISALDNAKLIDRPSNLSREVVNNLKDFNRKAKQLHDQISIISRGFAGTSKARIGVVSPEILGYAKKVIHANQIDLSSYNAFQHYIEGFIPKKSQIEKYLLVENIDLERIITFLSHLIETAALDYRKKVWDQQLKTIIGDESCIDFNTGKEISISDCNRKRDGIPIKASFMKMTRKEFINVSAFEAKKVNCDAKKAIEYFRFFIKDEKLKELEIINNEDCVFKAIPEQDLNCDGLIVRDQMVLEVDTNRIRPKTVDDLLDKYFFTEGGDKVAWIPLKNFE